VNEAVQLFAALIVIMHVVLKAQLAQSPVHPANTPVVGVSVSVTAVPSTKSAVQVAPHEMPAGAEDTEPAAPPVADTVTVSVRSSANDALTLEFADSVTTHAPVPVHAPDQPVNTEPAAGVGVSVTAVPLSKGATQVPGQDTPAGVEATVPLPLPEVVTVSVF